MIKAYICKFISLAIILSITLCMPFYYNVKANDTAVAPFIGFNVNVIGYDKEGIVKLSQSSTSNNFTGDITNVLLVERTSAGVTYQTSTASVGSVSGSGGTLNGDINLKLNSTTSYIYDRVIEIELLLDNYYTGYIDFSITGDKAFTDRLFVSGNTATIKFADNQSQSININYDLSITFISLTLNNNNERWDYPIESFAFLTYMIQNYPTQIEGINRYNQYHFPIFNLYKTDVIYKTFVGNNDNWTTTLVFYLNDSINGLNSAKNLFSVNRGEIISYKTINRFYFNDRIGYLCQIEIGNFATAGDLIITYNGTTNRKFIPIYANLKIYNKNVSTDFALTFGLSNNLLDNIEKIANGTQQSNESISNADNVNNDVKDIFDEQDSLVNENENNMQDNLDNLDIENKNNNLFGNTKFITSANWVKQQFEFFTNDNAFNYMITFSLVIGLGLVIVGKLRG